MTIIPIDQNQIDISVIQKAADFINDGMIIAFPTDTLYGIGCDPFNIEAINKLFSLKSRTKQKPINLLIDSERQLNEIVEDLPDVTQLLIESFWPGALTLIFKKKKIIPSILTSNLPTIGVRMPNNQIILELIKKVKRPLAVTSANISGKPSTTNAKQVYENFRDKIPLILDGGETSIGKESTIMDLTVIPPKILREGVLKMEDIQAILPYVETI
jgi:L-threonylcarbamoyladenylate synthase